MAACLDGTPNSMSNEVLEVVGRYAGLAGFSLGLILLIFRAVLKHNIFPTLNNQQAYSLLRLLIILTFSAGIFGVAAWAFTKGGGVPEPTPPETQFTISGHVIDKNTKEPVDESAIVVGGRTERGESDKVGNFFLSIKPPLPKNKMHLFILKERYEPFDLHVDIGENIDVELVPLKQPKQAEVAVARHPTETVVNRNEYDKGLKHFFWLYSFDAPGHQRRDWYQESASTWNEIYEDGRINHSRVVDANAMVDGNEGIICVGDNATLRLFIPNPDAHGANPTWLRFQDRESAPWNFMAPLTWVRTAGKNPQATK
jgi:hypothetical protein